MALPRIKPLIPQTPLCHTSLIRFRADQIGSNVNPEIEKLALQQTSPHLNIPDTTAMNILLFLLSLLLLLLSASSSPALVEETHSFQANFTLETIPHDGLLNATDVTRWANTTSEFLASLYANLDLANPIVGPGVDINVLSQEPYLIAPSNPNSSNYGAKIETEIFVQCKTEQTANHNYGSLALRMFDEDEQGNSIYFSSYLASLEAIGATFGSVSTVHLDVSSSEPVFELVDPIPTLPNANSPTMSPNSVPTATANPGSPVTTTTTSPTETATLLPTAIPATSLPSSNPSSRPTPAPTTLPPTGTIADSPIMMMTMSPTDTFTSMPTTVLATPPPSSNPSSGPTPAPTTLSPTGTVTGLVSPPPSSNPSSGPSPAPTTLPPTGTITDSPIMIMAIFSTNTLASLPTTVLVTPLPSSIPSSGPTTTPSVSPTGTVSESPTMMTTLSPTARLVGLPTAAPATPLPSSNPSSGPTPAPTTLSPTSYPETSQPTTAPQPTGRPTMSPTMAPVVQLETYSNKIELTLWGVTGNLQGDAETQFETATSKYLTSYAQDLLGGSIVRKVTVNLTNQQRGSRRLETAKDKENLNVDFATELQATSSLDAQSLIDGAFATSSRRETYRYALAATGDPVLQRISAVTRQGEEPDEGSSSEMGTLAIVAIAVATTVSVAAIIFAWWWFCMKEPEEGSNKSSVPQDRPMKQGPFTQAGETGGLEAEIIVDNSRDDVSTIGAPTIGTGWDGRSYADKTANNSSVRNLNFKRLLGRNPALGTTAEEGSYNADSKGDTYADDDLSIERAYDGNNR
eukprot:scaffold26088_cov132-Cylindrotheca_fusiformis.AAC.4